MIKANELRIGNWVYYNNALKRIVAITSGNTVKLNTLPKIIEDDILELTPIPLTPELLENCGFVLDKGVGVWFDKKEHDGFRITLWDSHEGRYLFTRQMPSNHIPVFHLHQLQNLYFSLTNQELTIHL
jgi:hypothetical protein